MDCHDRVMPLLSEISELLDQIRRPDRTHQIEQDWTFNEAIANGLATLASELRLVGAGELIQELEDVFALTGSPLRAASSWTNIDIAFLRFAAHLKDHEYRPKDSLRRTAGTTGLPPGRAQPKQREDARCRSRF